MIYCMQFILTRIQNTSMYNNIVNIIIFKLCSAMQRICRNSPAAKSAGENIYEKVFGL